MSEKKRNRRKFLADLLFAGGGLTAAALIAKTQSGGEAPAPHPPEPAPPPPIEPVPQPEAVPGLVAPPAPEPQIEGRVAMPELQRSKGEAVPPQYQKGQDCKVQLDGNVVAPEH